MRGLDINATFGKEIVAFGNVIDFGVNVRANHLIERSSLFIDDDGNETFDDFAGEFFFPSWTGRTTFTADIDDFRLTYQIRYVSDVEQAADEIDLFSDAFRNAPDGSGPTGFVGDTCTGGGAANFDGDGVFCRDVGFAEEQFYHTASLRYRFDGFTIIAGVDNIFNTRPPLVDSSEVLAIANTALGASYDYDGREFFASIRKEF